MPPIHPALRAAIRTRRLGLNLTLAEASERAGIALSQWHRLETADREISITLAATAARALGWSLSRLVREAESQDTKTAGRVSTRPRRSLSCQARKKFFQSHRSTRPVHGSNANNDWREHPTAPIQ